MQMVPQDCCRRLAPSAGGYRQDGERWTCPDCGTEFVHDNDEAEGPAWWPVERDDTPHQPYYDEVDDAARFPADA